MFDRNKMYDMPDAIVVKLRSIGKELSIDKMILFGSRARGDNHERSDIDLAIYAKDAEAYFLLQEALDEIDTLLSFDLVDLNSDSISNALREEIVKDGVIIYEEV